MMFLPRPTVITVVLAFLGGGASLQAQLPTFSEGDHLGYFATFKDRNIEFGITSLCAVRLMPGLASGLSATFLGGTYNIDIAPQMVATAADGKTTKRRITGSSLTSPDGVTDKFEKTTIRGEVTGGAKFEFTLEQNRGALLMGGNHLDPEETKSPHHFSIDIKIPAQIPGGKLDTLYKLSQEAADDRKARRELRDFLREYRSDRLTVRRTDGSETRYLLAEAAEGGTEAINGPGITELELQSSVYEARRLVITAENGSALTLSPTREDMLLPGFNLTWKNDPAKDPEGKARVAITVR